MEHVNTIQVRWKGQPVKVRIADLRLLEMMSDYRVLHLADDTRVMTEDPAEEICARLPMICFLQVSRKFVIHLGHITGLTDTHVTVGRVPVPLKRGGRREVEAALRQCSTVAGRWLPLS